MREEVSSMAAAAVLRGGRSGFSSRLLGSSTGTAHKPGQWRNPVLCEGVNVKAPERMEQLCSKRSLHVEPKWEPKRERVAHHPMETFSLLGAHQMYSLHLKKGQGEGKF
ncbi:uncharacterized protein [Miscanthus floridulus]|uniref:uncharacterized protein n=1 Tax=Miscanthus floridulus TaxID=154761 RepID=UPI00345A9BD5